MKKWLIRIFILIAVLALGLWATGNKHILIGIWHTYLIGKSKPDIDDFGHVESRLIEAGTCKEWPRSSNYGELTLPGEVLTKAEKWQTTALLFIQSDSILFERYWEGYGPDSISNSFSMAKSFTSLAIGTAIDNGKIKSVDQLVSDFLPWISEGEGKNLTVKHLLQMTSGINYGESYSNPFGYQAKSYYGDDLQDLTQDYKVSSAPGSVWWYQGGNTVLLDMVLEKATGQTLSDYFGENIYSKIGTCADAHWALDRDGKIEKAFSAFYATPYDFAKIGQLMLDSGRYNGSQIVSAEYLRESIQPVGVKDKDGNVVNHYGYQWWLGNILGHKVVTAQGLRGQYISAIPDLDMVVVKLGHTRSEDKIDNMKVDLRIWLETAIAMQVEANEK